MVEGFFGGWTLEGVHLEEPPDEVQEVLVLALEALLQRGVLGDQDVDLKLFLIAGCLCFLLALALALFFAVGLLVDQALAREEVRDQAAFLHHVLRDRPDDSDDTRQEPLH